VVMADGRIEQVGAPLDLYAAPATIRVAEAIGSPAMNLLPVTILRVDARGTTVTFGGEGGGGGECVVGVRVPGADIGARATLGVRPEHLRVELDGVFGGRVELFERLGPLSFAHLGERGSAGALVAQLPGDRAVHLGEAIRFWVAPRDAQLFAADGCAYPRLSL